MQLHQKCVRNTWNGSLGDIHALTMYSLEIHTHKGCGTFSAADRPCGPHARALVQIHAVKQLGTTWEAAN